MTVCNMTSRAVFIWTIMWEEVSEKDTFKVQKKAPKRSKKFVTSNNRIYTISVDTKIHPRAE